MSSTTVDAKIILSISESEKLFTGCPHTVAAFPFVAFTEKLPEKLINLMVEELEILEKDGVPFETAAVGDTSNNRIDMAVRDSKLRWWAEDHWVCSVIAHYIGLANKRYWEYDLSFLESIQVSVYEEGGNYKWHSDYGPSAHGNWTRKLSASVLITDPLEYDGGSLEFIDYHGNTVVAPREKGSIIVFDSRIPHRVTPITRGRRVSLVTWMMGPKLK
jgi:PKHD-type hydroxylase